MTVRLRARVPQSWWISISVVAASLLIVGVGFCLFDTDHGGRPDHGMPLDLCNGLLASALTVPVLIGLPLNGWATPAGAIPVPVLYLQIPAPPPKPALF